MLKQRAYILFIVSACLAVGTSACAQDEGKVVTLREVVDLLSLESPDARIEQLNFQNKRLQFENYKKSFLPSISLNFNPVSFNRSLRLLQNPTDGSYSYVKDYSNSSSAGLTVRQKIGVTGGEFSLSSDINYLNEFSSGRNSFSTMPFSIGYSQQLWGGSKQNRLEREIEYAKNQVAVKEYCAKLSQIQQQALGYYMAALFGKMERDLQLQMMQNADTLQQLAVIKLQAGRITEYDLKQIELQSVNAQYAYEKACQSYVDAQEKLALFLGTDKMEVAVPVFDVLSALSPNTVMHYVRQNNPFTKHQEIQLLEAERNLHSAKLNNRFNGSISLNYGVNKYADTFINAYRNLNKRQSIVVGFQIPIFQWGINRNRLRMAKNSYETSKIEQARQLREFENEVTKTINSYNHSVKLWQTAERAYQLSQEQYAMLIKKFALGKVSLYELTAAQNEQNTAMQRYYSAIRDTYNSYFALRNMALYDFKQNVELEEMLVRK